MPVQTSHRQTGLTLIEMLVALFIFSIISLAGVAVMQVTLRSQESFGVFSERLSELQLARAVLKADFAQTASRIVRDPYGAPEGPPFRGGEQSFGDPLVAFVRAGWENPNGSEARSSLQYLEYDFEDGQLIRRARPHLDAQRDSPVSERVLISGLERAEFTFFSSGQWREEWPVVDFQFTPSVVALDLSFSDGREIRQLFITSGEG